MLLMACAVLIVGLYCPQTKKGAVTYVLTQLSLVVVFVLTLVLRPLGHDVIALHGNFVSTQFVVVMQLFIYATSFFAFAYSRHFIRDRSMAETEYYSLGLFAVLGMMVMTSGASLLTLYLGLELLSLPLYAMVALQKDKSATAEAAMKYFVMGALASGMLLYGMSLVYGVTGSIHLVDIHAWVAGASQIPMLLVFGLVFMLAGLVFKFGAVPFHMWVPDVYDGAPTPVTGFLASAPKIAVFGMSLNILVGAFPKTMIIDWQQILVAVVFLSMALGNILAIAQTNIKRMLAYSSIAQLGYMLLGFVTGVSRGYEMSLFYALTYGLMAVAAFALIAILSKKGFEAENIEDFRGLNARSPWLAFLMLVTMFSMAGVPPTVGFIAKVGVLEALVNNGFVWLAVAALLFAIIGGYYYLRVVKVMYFEEPTENQEPLAVIPVDTNIILSINVIALLVLGMAPSYLIDLCRKSFSMFVSTVHGLPYV